MNTKWTWENASTLTVRDIPIGEFFTLDSENEEFVNTVYARVDSEDPNKMRTVAYLNDDTVDSVWVSLDAFATPVKTELRFYK